MKIQHSFMTPEGSCISVYQQRLPLLSEFAFCSPSPASALRTKHLLSEFAFCSPSEAEERSRGEKSRREAEESDTYLRLLHKF
jgi:hypothetical protein